MACFSPLIGYKARTPGKNGGFALVFDPELSNGQEMSVPCGQCIGCRLDYSRMWAMRCVHESSLYEENCFITLTYDDDHLPCDGSLVPDHFTDFMKRLRGRCDGETVRYFMCGEYGDNFDRPHYHALLFGLDFPDKYFWKSEDGYDLFRSDWLEERWSHGMCMIGACTYETAAYVARYIVKKKTGEQALLHYCNFDPVTGLIHADLHPEYCRMSRGRRPDGGIGYRWFAEFGDEVFPDDEVIMRGAPCRPPRFYQEIYKSNDPVGFEAVRRMRRVFADAHKEDSTPERLRDREVCKRAQVGLLKRSFEE